jgi:hypothetical protein
MWLKKILETKIRPVLQRTGEQANVSAFSFFFVFFLLTTYKFLLNAENWFGGVLFFSIFFYPCRVWTSGGGCR